jgi:Icc-related predicted phosphoesterase
MRVLAAADIHGELSVYEWLADVARQVQADVLILAGDLLEFDCEEKQTLQAARIISLLETYLVPVIYIMGNDDLISLDYESERLKPLHGRSVRLGQYNFVGYQYSLPFMGGRFEKPEQEIEADMGAIEPLLDDNTVFISHSPVYGVLDAITDLTGLSGGHAGSRSLRSILDQKSVLAHVYGHVHSSFGRLDNHFNVAAAGTRRTIWFDLPSLDHRVVIG